MLGIEDSGGQPAAHGTILHAVCEEALRTGRSVYSFVGEVRSYKGYSLEITDEHADLALQGLDYIDGIPGKLYIEKRVDLGRWMPGQFGTLDVGIAGRRLITIFDWKWGYIPVTPDENYQLPIYGLGFWDNFARHVTDATRFRFVIWQPFAPGGGGEWEMDLDELLDFGKKVKKAAAATYPVDAPRIPGTAQCAYCEGAKQMLCKEYSDYNLNLLIDDFDDMDKLIEHDLPPRLTTNGMTPERRSFILKHRPMFEKFLERLHAEAIDDAIKGWPTPGLKAVYGRAPRRKWIDDKKADEALERRLGEDRFTKKLMTPAKAQKELPDVQYEQIKKLVDQGEPKPILVDINDARDPVPTISDLFED